MPLTNAQKQARQRERVKAKLERLAALEDALSNSIFLCKKANDEGLWCEVACAPVKAINEIHALARKALGGVG